MISSSSPKTVLPPELQEPEKFLYDFSLIKLPDIQAITTVILLDEGGFVLTSDPRDTGAGGWTYAGVTAKKFGEYYPEVGLEVIKKLISTPGTQAALRQVVVSIYFQDYLNPAKRVTTTLPLQAFHLSCAINCGVGGMKEILNTAMLKNATKVVMSSQMAFLGAWKDHYFSLLTGDPSKIIYIHGWVNRVWRYLPNA